MRGFEPAIPIIVFLVQTYIIVTTSMALQLKCPTFSKFIDTGPEKDYCPLLFYVAIKIILKKISFLTTTQN
jgi:hypothetical protein